MMRRVPPEMFQFAVSSKAELYTAILHGFGEANERLETALGIDEVRARLRSVGWLEALDDEELAVALGQLERWGLLDVIQNHGENYRTAADYERRNLQYSLTKQGEAAYAGVQHALSVLASTGALQTAVLDAIADRLDELYVLLTTPDSQDRRIFSTVQELEGHLEGLRNNSKQFNAELQRLLRGEGADLTTFHEVKSATVAYLQEFVTNLDQRCHAIAAAGVRIEQHGVEAMQHRALAGAELPPTSEDDAEEQWLAHRRARWEGLRAWFWPDDGSTPRAEQLHTVARRAIVTLLQVLDRIVESRRRSSSAAADFRTLARWFTVAPSDEDLHRLWSAAFGLGSARHTHLAHPDPELVAPSTPWAQAPPVEVSALLRKSGRTERFTRTGKVRDVAELKRQRAERAQAERAQLEQTCSALATDGPVCLSRFAELDHTVFEHLLDMLGRALAAPADEHGRRVGATADGRAEVLLRDPADGRRAELRTQHGRLTGPDYLVEVRLTDSRREATG